MTHNPNLNLKLKFCICVVYPTVRVYIPSVYTRFILIIIGEKFNWKENELKTWLEKAMEGEKVKTKRFGNIDMF